MNPSGALLTRLGGVDVVSWNPARTVANSRATRLVDNFGDLLGPLLVERIAGATAMRRTNPPSGSSPSALVAVGSIMHLAPSGSAVWGTGVNFKLASKLPRWADTLDFRAVRGPYSARALTAAGITAPDVFGDPAMLLPQYMPELASWQAVGTGDLVVVPNLNDYESMSASATERGLAVVNPQASLASVLRSVAGSGFVIGSSLHAVVIADALGIPARFVSSPAEGSLKYLDYLSGSGRPLERIAQDLDSAIELGGHAPLAADLERLLATFPHDLWASAPVSDYPTFTERPSIIAAWEGILMEEEPDMARHATTFVEEVLPAVIEAGADTLAREGDDVPGPDRDGDLASIFAEACAYREALAASVRATDLADDFRPHLAAIDSGNLDQLIRSLWLRREGPHALMRSIRSSGGRHVMSIAVRPGSLTNDIESIELIVTDDEGRGHNVSVPVFAMYRRQWSIDVCGSVEMPHGDLIASIDVRITDHDGRTDVLPVGDVEHRSLSLRGYPSVADAPRWSGVHRQERSA